MKTGNNYKSLAAYQESKTLVKLIYQHIRKFPPEENFALGSQLRRAAISIPSNIAEGMGRYSVKDQCHFLEIAFGSLLEISAQIDISYDLGYITQQNKEEIESKIDSIAALLSGLRNKRLDALNATNH